MPLKVVGVGLVAWAVPVGLWSQWPAATASSPTMALFFTGAALVTFGGAYAVLAYVAQQAVQVYGWLTPSEMITGLALAETTPGPLIMVVQFVAFVGAYHDPGSLNPWVAAVARVPPDHLGDLRAVLRVRLRRRPLRGTTPRQPRALGGADRDHGGRGRRDREPRDLLRHPHPVPRRQHVHLGSGGPPGARTWTASSHSRSRWPPSRRSCSSAPEWSVLRTLGACALVGLGAGIIELLAT